MKGYKTYITAAAALLTAAGGFLTGNLPLAEAVQLGFTALLGAFTRNAIATK